MVTLRSIIPGFTGSADTGAGNGEGRTIVIDVDGQLTKMSPQAYEAYRAQREQLQLAQSKLQQLSGGEVPDVVTEGQADGKPDAAGNLAVETDNEEVDISPIVISKQPDMGQATTEEAKPAEIDVGDFLPFAELIANAMEGTPQEFAEDLAASAEGGNQDARFLLLYLSTATYDKLMDLVKPYAQTEGLTEYIKKLVDKKEWVEEALASIRQLIP